MSKKEPIVVYWMPHTIPDYQYNMLLLDNLTFKSVMRDISTRRAKNPKLPVSQKWQVEDMARGSYHLCTALHNLVDNVYYLESPFDVDIKLDENGTILRTQNSYENWFRERGQTIENAFNLDFLAEMSLFCEEPLEISYTPPYLHQTTQTSYGFVSSVKFSISSWFRPIVCIYQLWPGVKELKIKKGEPFVYVHFHTNRPIVFKQVQMTETIMSISKACLTHKFSHKFQPLEWMYKKFNEKGLKESLLKEIKNNVLTTNNQRKDEE